MQYYRNSRVKLREYTDLHNDRYLKSGNSLEPFHDVTRRPYGNIPNCVPAHDIWVFHEDPARDPDRLYMTIKNPSKPYRPAYLA